jgi:hypothetical protein
MHLKQTSKKDTHIHGRKEMAETKIRQSQDLRRSPTKKVKCIVRRTEVSTDTTGTNNLTYINHKTQEQTWMSKEKLEKITAEMLAWVYESSEATKLSKFFHMHGIRNKTALDWCKKWPKFAEAYQLAKEIIGNRREHGALTKVFDAGLVIKSMPMYDEDWKEECNRVIRQKLEVAAAEPPKIKKLTVMMIKYTDKNGNELEDETEEDNLQAK